MTTLPEKQTAPASDNRMPGSLLFISQSSISEINIVGGASTETYGGETQFTVNALTAFSWIGLSAKSYHPCCKLDAAPD
jgi:hypothetical protein